jgi:hypothetical protein
MSRYDAFRELFADAIDPQFYTLDYLDGLVRSGKAECWFSDHAAIVAELRQYPGGAKVIHGLVAAGPMDEVLDLIAAAEKWAKANGCTHAEVESRSGWVRLLKDRDYEICQTLLRKAL